MADGNFGFPHPTAKMADSKHDVPGENNMIGTVRKVIFFALWAGLAGTVTTVAYAADDGFKPIFDGKSLDGWQAADKSYWSVEEGAITAKITNEHPCNINQYLIWKGAELGDFELKLKFRMQSDADVNGGFQFRSKELPDHDVAGYQVDNDTRGGWLVRLYDEHGRHQLALRGQRADISADGKITHTEIKDATGEPGFKLSEFHEYRLVCVGPRLTLYVNNKLMAEVIDNDPTQQDFKGILALQLHSGPPMTVQFKDIRLKKLD
jgi:hypothetical protein